MCLDHVVALTWSRHMDITHIVVANDEAGNNSLLKKTMKMATPPGIKTSITSVDEAIEILKDDRTNNFKILLLVDSPYDALRVHIAIPTLKSINLGSYGRVVAKKGEEKRTPYAPNLYLAKEDEKVFRNILEKGVEIYYQPTPGEAKVDLKKILK
jgi:mannose/fructose/N-acetylgalactosamine-specific phosphotransferase system component IIB